MSKLYLQEKLVGAPGQMVGFDADGKAVAEDNIGQGGIGVNLHDNWYFCRSINQRGATSYTAAGYTIDRWILSNPGQGITMGNNGITVLSAGAEWSQRMEGIAAYAGRPITLSMLLADGTLHTGTVAVINWALDTPQTAFDNDVMSCTITQIGTDVCETTYTMKAAGLVLVAAKMEFGINQTLAKKEGNIWALNDHQFDEAVELLKCQMYFIPTAAGFFPVHYIDGAQFLAMVPASMKATPSALNTENEIFAEGAIWKKINLAMIHYFKSCVTLQYKTDGYPDATLRSSYLLRKIPALSCEP